MQILVIFFLAAFVGCYGDQSECLEKADPCVNDLLTSLADDSSDDNRCKELIDSIECLDEAVESCGEGELEEAVKIGLEALKDLKKENCNAHNSLSEDGEILKCLEANEADVLGCMGEVTAEVLEALSDQSDDENYQNRVTCGLFLRFGQCAVKKIEEKCGARAAVVAGSQMNDVPVEIVNACRASGILLHAGTFDEEDRKK